MSSHLDTGTIQQAQGAALFSCALCERDLSQSDLADLGLRTPDSEESAEEFCDAELIDLNELRHLHCGDRAKAPV